MSIYDGELLEKATSSTSLETRLSVNAKYSSTNFSEWLWSKIEVEKGDDILDVGCGNGIQSIVFANKTGSQGTVSAIDLSEESVRELNRKANEKDLRNIQAVKGDMLDLENFIEKVFSKKQYDIAHSTYAIYYAKNHIKVLDTMLKYLNRDGKLIIFTPYKPHGMVDFIKQFTQIPTQVQECFEFGPQVLEPYFREHFWDVEIHFFHNVVTLPSADVFMQLYRSTTYYDKTKEEEVMQAVQQEIDKNGCFKFTKNGYLIFGKNQF